MCLIVFANHVHPQYPLILAANRDEFYDRPTRPVHRWKTRPPIIAGKDLKAGGTWLGIAENGRFAALTNYRNIHEIKEDAISRGKIVTDFLLDKRKERTTLENILEHGDDYNGFNLIAGRYDHLYYMTNKKNKIVSVEPGFHAISNAFMDSPWPKSEEALMHFRKFVTQDNIGEEAIFELLLHDRRYPEDQLPATGLSSEMEKAVSPIFIQTEHYGTRSSTLLYADHHGNATLVERSYIPGTKKVETENRFHIRLEITPQEETDRRKLPNRFP